MTSKTQVVMVTYTAHSRFTIPDDIDIEKLIQERKAYVLWDILHICTGDIDDKTAWIEIESHVDAQESIDWKRGGVLSVDDYDETVDGFKEDEDDYDAPNVFPYKKCFECSNRSSCGNYNTDKQWVCEDCCESE